VASFIHDQTMWEMSRHFPMCIEHTRRNQRSAYHDNVMLGKTW